MVFDNERRIVADAVRRMFERKLTVGTWGNVSVRARDRDGCIITPSGKNYLETGPEDMVVIDLDGNVIEGRWRPSTELAMHCEIYRRREDVNAVVHIHPTYSSILSVLGEGIPPIMEDMVMLLGEEVRVSEYALPGTKEIARNAAEALGKNNAVILANHGSVCVGEDMDRALTACEVLEKSAQIYFYSRLLGDPKVLPGDDVMELMRKARGYLGQWKQE